MNINLRHPTFEQCPNCFNVWNEHTTMGVYTPVTGTWFCSMACMIDFASIHNCRRGVQVWTGVAWVPCQGIDGDIQCPECENGNWNATGHQVVGIEWNN